MQCDFAVEVRKENGVWRKILCREDATKYLLNDCMSIVGCRCLKHAEWTVANVPAKLSMELIEDPEGQG